MPGNLTEKEGHLKVLDRSPEKSPPRARTQIIHCETVTLNREIFLGILSGLRMSRGPLKRVESPYG